MGRNETSHYPVLIIGGGTAGLTVAARLTRVRKRPVITVIEPSSKHYYQPLWTLVGAGVMKKERTVREEKDYIPAGVTWLQDAVTDLRPADNQVLTRDGRTLTYDYLVVAAGIQIDWEKVKGLRENLGHHGICTNYAYDYVDSTWENIKISKGQCVVYRPCDSGQMRRRTPEDHVPGRILVP